MIDSVRDREIAVQDAVSADYESIRYLKDYSVMYQNSWFLKSFDLFYERIIM